MSGSYPIWVVPFMVRGPGAGLALLMPSASGTILEPLTWLGQLLKDAGVLIADVEGIVKGAVSTIEQAVGGEVAIAQALSLLSTTKQVSAPGSAAAQLWAEVAARLK